MCNENDADKKSFTLHETERDKLIYTYKYNPWIETSGGTKVNSLKSVYNSKEGRFVCAILVIHSLSKYIIY